MTGEFSINFAAVNMHRPRRVEFLIAAVLLGGWALWGG
jgi:hypothetical protein